MLSFPKSPVLLGLALLCSLLVPASASAIPVGPGGWGRVGYGAHPGDVSLNFTPSALNADKPGALLVGGGFTDAGGEPAGDRIASWDGQDWSAVSSSASGIDNGLVAAIAYDATTGRIFAGGTFLNAGGNAAADSLAVWNGTSWAPFCNDPTPPAFSGLVAALQIIGNTLWVGGSFQNGAHLPTADYLLACDLTTGAASSPYAVDGDGQPIYDLTANGAGTLFVAGPSINYGGIPGADRVAARSSGGVWSAMGAAGAVTGIARSIEAVGSDVFVGSDGSNIAGIAQADHVARWDGAAWNAVGADAATTNGYFPASASINAIRNTPSGLVAAGQFLNADANPLADHIALFNGSSWTTMGSDGAGNGAINPNVLSLAMFGSTLFAAGGFTSAGGDPKAHGIACFGGCTPLRASTTTVACKPGVAMQETKTTCTASVRDGDGSGSKATGVVSFASGASGRFSPASCTLVPDVGKPTSSCSVSYKPDALGVHGLSIGYAGSSDVAASSTTLSLTVTRSNSFEINPGASCSGACSSFQVKADFAALGKVVVVQSKPVQGAKAAALVKKLKKSVKAGVNKLKVTLTPAGRQALRANGSLVVKLRVTFTPKGGTPNSHVRRFTIRLPD